MIANIIKEQACMVPDMYRCGLGKFHGALRSAVIPVVKCANNYHTEEILLCCVDGRPCAK